MRHFHQFNDETIDKLFIKKPGEFDKNTDREKLSYALGATLYMPSHKDVAHKIITGKFPGLTTFVMCFEDAIRPEDLTEAEKNVLEVLNTFSRAVEQGVVLASDIPLFFLRVRSLEQFCNFMYGLMDKGEMTSAQAQYLTGFIFPKFKTDQAFQYLHHVEQLSDWLKTKFYGMPILESKEFLYKETRYEQLQKIKELIDERKDCVLNVRAGGTDFSALFGLRRSIHNTIYDLQVVTDCLVDILNYFTRTENSYVVPGVVWEYFANHPAKRNNRISTDKAYQGLIKEVLLDKTNGFVGKTIIHPSHITIVNALQVVTEEEYRDALMIVEHQGGGVLKGSNGNKMNETNPHLAWAKKTLLRADIYGVLREGVSYEELF